MNPKTTLAKAANLIDERGASYGGVEQSFTRAAEIATLIVGRPVTPIEVVLMLHAVKLARRVENPTNPDHYLDAINYLAFGHDFALGGDATGAIQPPGYLSSSANAALNALAEIRRPDAAKIEAARERALGAGLLPDEDEEAKRIARTYAPKKPVAAE